MSFPFGHLARPLLGAGVLVVLLGSLLVLRPWYTPPAARCVIPAGTVGCPGLLFRLEVQLRANNKELDQTNDWVAAEQGAVREQIGQDGTGLLATSKLDVLYLLAGQIDQEIDKISSLSTGITNQGATLVSLRHPLVEQVATAPFDTNRLPGLGVALNNQEMRAKKLVGLLQTMHGQVEARAKTSLRFASNSGHVFVALPNSVFSEDTNLTGPSGLTAEGIDAYLAGTPLAGLGTAFMDAETSYHVNARYFLAHAILESGFGTSLIAKEKNNLFGYGANDANPVADANSFTSMAAGILFVARQVHIHLLEQQREVLPGTDLAGHECLLRLGSFLGGESGGTGQWNYNLLASALKDWVGLKVGTRRVSGEGGSLDLIRKEKYTLLDFSLIHQVRFTHPG